MDFAVPILYYYSKTKSHQQNFAQSNLYEEIT